MEKLLKDNTNKIDVLNHGFVRLVNHMGNDLSIVRAARVSYNAAARTGKNKGSDYRLINYLWANKHTTPFESVEFQFEVKAPVFVFRQWHRHRTWSFNELSARYKELPNEYFIPDTKMIGLQSTDNKQGRDTNRVSDALHDEIELLKTSCENSFKVYNKLLLAGWPRELARSVLPVAAYSHMFAKVNLRNLFHFLDLRCDNHAQYEIRVYADAMLKLIEPIVPMATKAWQYGK